jgi:hypothetical protein
MSLSINGNREHQRKNIGEIMRMLNIGDGHPGAAAGTVHCASKQEMLKKKRDLLNQTSSGPPTNGVARMRI